jgi:hypothetical protein
MVRRMTSMPMIIRTTAHLPQRLLLRRHLARAAAGLRRLA